MAKPRPDLANSKEAAARYVQWLSTIEQVDKVMLQGSRSPLREKEPNATSDWDFIVITSIKNFKLMRPRDFTKSDNPEALQPIHADLVIISHGHTEYLKKAVELWPEDTHGVLQ